MEKTYAVYIHINKINNKVYVGQTKKKPEYRWSNGKGYASCPVFYKAILKYGWENFDHQIIKTGLTLEEANELEKELIQQYHSTDSNYGYNILEGGNNSKRTEEQKQQHSQFMKEKWQDEEYREYYIQMMKEKWQNKEYRNKVIQAISGENSHFYGSNKSGANNPMYGKHHTEETKRKISEKKKQLYAAGLGKDITGGKNPMARKVMCINNQKIFDCVKDAANWAGVSSTAICNCLTGKTKTSGTDPETQERLQWQYM